MRSLMQITGSLITDIEFFLSLGALVGVFIYLVLRQPFVGMAVFIFLVLTRAHEYIPNSHKFRPSVVIGGIMLLGLFFYFLRNHQPLYFGMPQILILVAFIAWCWISLLFQGQVMYDRNGRILLEPLLLVFVAFFTVSNTIKNWATLWRFLIVLVWAGFTISVLTLIQSFTGEGMGWAYQNEGERFVRAGTMGINPNGVAMALTALLPIVYFLLDNARNAPLLKSFCFLNIGLFIVTTFMTYSRAGFFNLVIFLLFTMARKLNTKQIVSAVVLITVIYLNVPDAFWERIESITTTDKTGSGRTVIYDTAMNMIEANPFTGVGYGQFIYWYRHYGGGIWASVSSHNTYLGIAAETGLINLAIFLSLYVVSLLDLHRLKRKAKRREDKRLATLANALTTGIILAMLSGFTGELSDWILVYVYLAIVVVLKRLASPIFVGRREPPAILSPPFTIESAYDKKEIASANVAQAQCH